MHCACSHFGHWILYSHCRLWFTIRRYNQSCSLCAKRSPKWIIRGHKHSFRMECKPIYKIESKSLKLRTKYRNMKKNLGHFISILVNELYASSHWMSTSFIQLEKCWISNLLLTIRHHICHEHTICLSSANIKW